MTTMQDVIYSDNRTEGLWFQRLDPRLRDCEIVVLRSRDLNVDPRVRELLKYDRPDIILIREGEPVLVVEKTREVPTGHNVGQRMARLVRAVELGVPTIKFFPFDAMKHGVYAGRCFLNARLLLAFERITDIHSCPLLAVNWPSDGSYELIDDGAEDDRMRELVSNYLDSEFDPFCSAFEEQVGFMGGEYRRRTARNPRYKKPPASVRFEDTRELVLRRNLPSDIAETLLWNDESVVYSIGMTPEKCRREDPYTGTQFIYDYLWCRAGRLPHQKERNLVLEFPMLDRATFVANNPNDAARKSSNWYLAASALVFADDALLVNV